MDRSVLFVSKNRQLTAKIKSSVQQFNNICFSNEYNIESIHNNYDVLIYPSNPYLKSKMLEGSNMPDIIVYGNKAHLKYCFQKGCQDYLKIPWDYEELLLRITRTVTDRIYYKKDKNIFLGNNLILSINSIPVFLTYQEFKILKLLFKFPNIPISREILYQSLNYRDETISRVVEVHISNIRKKLQNTQFKIKNLRNKGYIIQVI